MKNGQIEGVLSLIKHRKSFVTLGADCGILRSLQKEMLIPGKAVGLQRRMGFRWECCPRERLVVVALIFQLFSGKICSHRLYSQIRWLLMAAAWETGEFGFWE